MAHGTSVRTPTGTSATTNGTSNTIWTIWNESITCGASTTANGIIWVRWSNSASTTGALTFTDTSTVAWVNWARLQERSAEQVRADLRHQEERRAQRLKIEAEEAEAKKRAEKLLTEHLSPPQREQLAQKGHFELDVISRSGERRRYQIRRGYAGNVKQVDPSSGRVLKTLCIHPRDRVPDADAMLAQKLLLEANETEFLRVANHS